MDTICFIGCGAVGFALLEIFKLEKLYYDCNFIIIEPREIPDLESVMTGRNYKHIKRAVTKANYKRLFNFLNNKTFVVNVSVNVDSINLLEICREKQAWYIDTSIEMYEDYIACPVEEISKYSDFKRNNLFHQDLQSVRVTKGSKKTRICSAGMNPGLISEYMKKGLREYGKLRHINLKDDNYGKLAHDLGMEKCVIVEFDSQKSKVEATPELFVNTWSCIGFQEEAVDLVMMNLRDQDISRYEDAGINLIKPTEGNKSTHIRFIPERGMDSLFESKTLDYEGNPFKYRGYLIPHAETVTISNFLKFENQYSPTVFYCYAPCSEAIKSLNYVRDNDYKFLKNYIVLRNKDISSGWDSIGCLLTFKNGDEFWCGTVCGKKDMQKLGFRSNATVIQVGAFMSASMRYILENKNMGLLTPEDISDKFIFKYANPYLGHQYCKLIPPSIV